MKRPLQIGFLASHGGSGMRAVLEAARDGALAARGVVMISNNEKAEAHAVAASFGTPSVVLNAKRAGDEGALDAQIAATLERAGAELVVMSGYMRLLGPVTVRRYANRILNIHPALLPAFGGKGLYGDNVHHAVIAAGARESGASVHLVDEVYDHGRVLAQARTPVGPEDTMETLRARVRALEGPLYVQTIQAIAAGELDLGSTLGA
jgi:phosphoribosylglycinamide formyltransferase-1